MMKVKDKNTEGEKHVVLEDTDAVIFIDTTSGKTAVHWPSKVTKKTLSRIIYSLTHASLMITEKSIEEGLTIEDITAINMMAYDDIADKEASLLFDKEKEKTFEHTDLKHGFVVSGNSTIH